MICKDALEFGNEFLDNCSLWIVSDTKNLVRVLIIQAIFPKEFVPSSIRAYKDPPTKLVTKGHVL